VSPKLTLREFHERRNKILIIRTSRGIGDILTHRMVFEDFKLTMPEAYLVFACPAKYHELLLGHPYLDEVVDSARVNVTDYMISYNTSQCCILQESATAPFIDQTRPDIWAEHCGVKLTKHEMYLPFLTEERIQAGEQRVNKLQGMMGYPRHNKRVLLCPAAFEPMRTLTDGQIERVVDYLRKKKLFVYATHTNDIPLLKQLGVPLLRNFSIQDWMSFIHAADYVVSVDTATFHYAGGIKKPLTGIFTYVDGKLRGKYYDFVLVQKHRDNGDWSCGPCFAWTECSHPKCQNPGPVFEQKPCMTELTVEEICQGIEKMLERWPV